MARGKEHSNNAVQYATAFDKIFAEIDVHVATAGILGGLASVGGITPPFTRLLMMFSGFGGGVGSQNMNADQKALTDAMLMVVSPAVGISDLIFGWLTTASDPNTKPEVKEQALRSLALFCSGAMEGMLMMRMVSSPGSMDMITTLIKQPAEIVKGIGEIVPG